MSDSAVAYLMETAAKRFGFLGGSFDPVHFGHLIKAQDAQEALNLDRVYFVPAAQNPHKRNAPIASAGDRLAMIRAALDPFPWCDYLDLELRREEGPSFTVDTVQSLRDEFGDAELYWIIGADQLAGLPRWHRIGELTQQISFICVDRPGWAGDSPPDLPELRLHRVKGHAIEVSSTEIRHRIAHGQSVELFVPSAVSAYMEQRRIYQQHLAHDNRGTNDDYQRTDQTRL